MVWSTRSPDEMRLGLREVEAGLSEMRCEQAVLVGELDMVNIAAGDGHRSMVDSLSAEFDLTGHNASDMVFAARHLVKYRRTEFRLGERGITFDRAVATIRLAEAGADPDTLDHAASRFVSIQPSLDESSWRLSGLLPAVEGRIVEQALHATADKLRLLPGSDTCTRARRQADALAMITHQALNRTGDPETRPDSGGSVTVLVNLDEANGTGGDHGATIEYGPRVGPTVLDELLGGGTIQIIGLDDGTPVATPTNGHRTDPNSPPHKRQLLKPLPHRPP